MAIEKVFRIEADAPAIWRALWSELGDAGAGPSRLEPESAWPERLSLHVDLAGVRCRLTYTIANEDNFCVVTAALEPLGARYRLYQALTFGHFRRNCELLLAAGLANLKAAVEGGDGPEAGGPA
ncbi:MAG TPA: hypothetical protein VNN10_14370 [Dehalococcoidia bacterium]|nr:hypothetical protein [Dehalococcoidia bacterium]